MSPARSILAGTGLGADHLPGGGDDTFAAGTIGAVNIGSKIGAVTFGNVINSVIAAGLSNPDGLPNNADDTIFGATPAEKLTSKIAALVIKGTDITGSYFASGKFTAKPKVGATVVTFPNPLFKVAS